jgi:hypothetical protein
VGVIDGIVRVWSLVVVFPGIGVERFVVVVSVEVIDVAGAEVGWIFV